MLRLRRKSKIDRVKYNYHNTSLSDNLRTIFLVNLIKYIILRYFKGAIRVDQGY